MRKSITANSGHVGVPFKLAAEAVSAAWKRKHGAVTCPALSHALSMSSGGIWVIVEAEAGTTVAHVIGTMAVLVEDMPVESVLETPEIDTDTPPAHVYPSRMRSDWPKPNQNAAITIKKRRVFHVPE